MSLYYVILNSRGRITVWLLFASLVVSPNGFGGYLFPYDRATTGTADGSTETSNALREIIASGQLTDLRWPNFSDYRSHLQNFYGPTSYGLAWLREGRATPQALAIIEVLKRADQNGLHAEDYDGPRWTERLTRLHQPEDLARFDAALSVCVMRYISDVRIGKVNPQ